MAVIDVHKPPQGVFSRFRGLHDHGDDAVAQEMDAEAARVWALLDKS